MTDSEYQAFKIENEIYVLNLHLKDTENPSKYSLPMTSDDRHQTIASLKTRIAGKQIELSNLKNQ